GPRVLPARSAAPIRLGPPVAGPRRRRRDGRRLHRHRHRVLPGRALGAAVHALPAGARRPRLHVGDRRPAASALAATPAPAVRQARRRGVRDLSDLAVAGDARATLIAELREHALVIGEVTLTSGRKAQYYVDAKRALLRPAAYRSVGELIAARATELGATAVGGMTIGADPLACAAIGAAGGDGLVAFFVRKERKEHG